MTASVRRFFSVGLARHALVWLVVSTAALTAAAAQPARVVDMRIGVHGDQTRVVIELDAPSGHQVERSAGDADSLAVRLDARGERRSVASRSPLVEGVTLEPGDGGAVARILLREPGLDYSEMLLDAPPRIVIDVRRARPAAASRSKAPGRIEDAAKPAESAAVKRAEPEPVEVAVAEPEPTEEPPPVSAPAPEARDPFVPPASYRALVAAQQAAAAAPAPPAAAPPEPLPSAPPAPDAEEAIPTAAVSAAPPRGMASPPQMAGLPPQISAAIEPLRGWLAGIDPAGAVVVLAGLVASWIFYRRMLARRTRQRVMEEAGTELTIFGDAPRSEREPEVVSAEAPEIAIPVVAAGIEIPAVDDEVADEPTPAPEPFRFTPPERPIERTPPQLSLVMPSEEPAPGWQTLAVPAAEAEPEIATPPAPSAPPSDASEDRVAILERRILRLEGRIEELLESRQRLERYAAAQNEELRVQRAAIARTQRVLRGVVRPEEGGSDAARLVPPPPAE